MKTVQKIFPQISRPWFPYGKKRESKKNLKKFHNVQEINENSFPNDQQKIELKLYWKWP